MNTPKQWWAPVWTGLVMDCEGTHCRRMKSAVWLWLYCVLNADRRSGVLLRKLDTIARDMGVPRITLTRWLTILRKEGYLETRRTGRYLAIGVLKWKLREVSHPTSLISQKRDIRCIKNDISQRPPERRMPALLSGKSALGAISNDISITREILKIDIDRTYKSENGIDLTPRAALLADDLAEVLDDQPALPFYRSVAQRVPERVLRRLLGEVKEIPAAEIKKSRGALFNFLVQQYLDEHSA